MTSVMADEVSGISSLLDHNPVSGEPKRGSQRFWTTRELKVLKDQYPQGGVSVCLTALPGRTAASIYGKAGQLGLVAPAFTLSPARMKWETSEQIDALIRRTYQKAPTKKDVLSCANVCGRPRWWVSKRAQKLGLVSPRFKQPAWTQEEESLVTENAHRSPKALRGLLRRHGCDRSETAIIVKLKRLGADRTDPDHLNASQLARVMGVDRSTVNGWIAKGWLKAGRRQATAADDFWWIHRREIARFVVENVAAVDLRKVDKFWFVDLLVHDARPTGKGTSKKSEVIAIKKARPDLKAHEIAAMVDSPVNSVAVMLSSARKAGAL